MTAYEEMIIKATGCPPEEACKVETVMRLDVFHSTLDWLSEAEFRRGARKAWRLLSDDREDYEDYFRQCRASLGLPPESCPPSDATAAADADQADVLPEDPPVLWERKQTILNLVVFREHDGETLEQGCRFHLAPCADGRWFVWAEARQPANAPEPCDAFYDFYDGSGRAFATRGEALVAIYEFGSEFCVEEADDTETMLDSKAE